MNPPSPNPLPELDDCPPMPGVNFPPDPTWVLPQYHRAYATDSTAINFALPPWPAQEARLWQRCRDRDPRFRLAGCRPGPPRGAVCKKYTLDRLLVDNSGKVTFSKPAGLAVATTDHRGTY